MGGVHIISLGGLMLDADVSVAAAPCLSYALTQGTLMFMFTPLSLEKILFSHVDAICFQENSAWQRECHVSVCFSCHKAAVF